MQWRDMRHRWREGKGYNFEQGGLGRSHGRGSLRKDLKVRELARGLKCHSLPRKQDGLDRVSQGESCRSSRSGKYRRTRLCRSSEAIVKFFGFYAD